jgi:hypothetical protein
MWRSPELRGDGAKWEHVGPVFESNATVLPNGYLSKEFVTIDMIGQMPGDPSDDTLLFLNNVGGNGGGDGCCDGTTSYFVLTQPDGPGTPFDYATNAGFRQGMVDWGSFALLNDDGTGKKGLDLLAGTASRGFSMARTLGSEEADQVTKDGRRVLIGWTGPADGPAFSGQGSAQSLPRDLSLAGDKTLLQAIAPELQALRRTHMRLEKGGFANVGLQVEVLAQLPAACGQVGSRAACGVSLLGDGGAERVLVTLLPDVGLVSVDATSMGNTAVRAGPLPAPNAAGGWTVHAIVDHSIVELIVNNATSFVVYAAPSSSETPGRVGLVDVDAGGLAELWLLASSNHTLE